MKKLITAILLLALALPSFAQTEQEHKWTVRGSAGYYPSVPTLALPFVAIAIGLSADSDAGEKTKVDFPPYASIEAQYAFNEKWSIGASVGYSGFVAKVLNADKTIKSQSDFTLIPLTIVGRCNYLNRPSVKLYGSLEGGVFFELGSKLQVVPDVQLNPIGVEFGRRFFGLAEIGIGMNYAGLRAGIGYRF